MKIGELAQRTGVPTRLLRYYEEVDILHPARGSNGYRVYGEPAIERVLQIRELLEAGLTTDMIREVLPCLEARAGEGTDIDCQQQADLESLERQLKGIESRIRILQRNRQAIKTYLSAWRQAGVPN